MRTKAALLRRPESPPVVTPVRNSLDANVRREDKSNVVTLYRKSSPINKLTPVEQELRDMFQEIYRNQTQPKESLPEISAAAGADAVNDDDTLLLEAALAFGNPISGYVVTNGKGEYTEDDFVMIDGKPVLAPQRLRRKVVGKDPKGNNIYGLVPDQLIHSQTKVEKECILSWYPEPFASQKRQLENAKLGLYAGHTLRRITWREIKYNTYYHPLDMNKEPTLYHLNNGEKLKDSFHESGRPGFFGEDNIRWEENYRKKALLQGFTPKPEDVRPAAKCTWFSNDKDDAKRLAKKKTKKSKDHRKKQGKSVVPPPKAAGDYRPVPKWWWFLKNPDGMSTVFKDELPWPNGYVDPEARKALKEHNEFAAEWMNNERVFFSTWLFADPQSNQTQSGNSFGDLFVGEAANDSMEPEEDSILSPEHEAKDEVAIPYPQPVDDDTRLASERAWEEFNKRRPRQVDITEDLIRKARDHDAALGKETASQQLVPDGAERLTDGVVFVGEGGFTTVKQIFSDPELREALAREGMGATSTPPKMERMLSPHARVRLPGGTKDFALDTVEGLIEIETMMDNLNERIGNIARLEDFLESLRETTMLNLGMLGEDEKYDKYNSLFSTSEIVRPVVRKMQSTDIGLPVDDISGTVGHASIRYGNRAPETWAQPSPAFAKYMDTVRRMQFVRNRHVRSLTKSFKYNPGNPKGSGRLAILHRMEELQKLRDNDTSPAAVKDRMRRLRLEQSEQRIAALHKINRVNLRPFALKAKRLKRAMLQRNRMRLNAAWYKERRRAFGDLCRTNTYNRVVGAAKRALRARKKLLRLREMKQFRMFEVNKQLRAEYLDLKTWEKQWKRAWGTTPLENKLLRKEKTQRLFIARERRLLRALRIKREVERIGAKRAYVDYLRRKENSWSNRIKRTMSRFKDTFKKKFLSPVRELGMADKAIKEPVVGYIEVQHESAQSSPSLPKVTSKAEPKQSGVVQANAKPNVRLFIGENIKWKKTESGVYIPKGYVFGDFEFTVEGQDQTLKRMLDKVSNG